MAHLIAKLRTGLCPGRRFVPLQMQHVGHLWPSRRPDTCRCPSRTQATSRPPTPLRWDDRSTLLHLPANAQLFASWILQVWCPRYTPYLVHPLALLA